MTSLKALRDGLQALGLSSKQADLYLLLVTHNELRVQEIVKLSRTPRSSVYESLRRLSDLGIVEEIIDDTYKRFRAAPIDIMRHSLDEQILSLQQQAKDLDALERSIRRLTAPEPGPTNVRYYKGRAGARQVYWNTLKSSDIVYVYSEWHRQEYVGLAYYENFAAEARRRSVAEKVLINMTAATLQSIKRDNVTESAIARTRIADIRVLDALDVRIKGDTLIYNTTYAQVFLKNVEIHGFEIESSDFVETQRSIFETLWKKATPVIDFLHHGGH
ncbi:MAG TPA: helix-turn-helix domain-containing protein [Candidatus Saccharimonadales bacterium]|nr:helix-turn-helix domain-containing protein [Candidatus Saccharimonadales bacterium]